MIVCDICGGETREKFGAVVTLNMVDAVPVPLSANMHLCPKCRVKATEYIREEVGKVLSAMKEQHRVATRGNGGKEK